MIQNQMSERQVKISERCGFMMQEVGSFKITHDIHGGFGDISVRVDTVRRETFVVGVTLGGWNFQHPDHPDSESGSM